MRKMKLLKRLMVGKRSYDSDSVVEMDDYQANLAIKWNTAIVTDEPLNDATPKPAKGVVETASTAPARERR